MPNSIAGTTASAEHSATSQDRQRSAHAPNSSTTFSQPTVEASNQRSLLRSTPTSSRMAKPATANAPTREASIHSTTVESVRGGSATGSNGNESAGTGSAPAGEGAAS